MTQSRSLTFVIEVKRWPIKALIHGSKSTTLHWKSLLDQINIIAVNMSAA